MSAGRARSKISAEGYALAVLHDPFVHSPQPQRESQVSAVRGGLGDECRHDRCRLS